MVQDDLSLVIGHFLAAWNLNLWAGTQAGALRHIRPGSPISKSDPREQRGRGNRVGGADRDRLLFWGSGAQGSEVSLAMVQGIHGGRVPPR